jgi:hypothetical protein
MRTFMGEVILKKIKHGLIILFVLCVILGSAGLSCESVWAAGGDGSGGGGGASIPLYMNWSYPSNGQTGVSVNPVIQCKFTHNVSNSNVVERNKTKVQLCDSDGNNVDITVFTADIQIEFEKRQFIYVSPVKQLEYGTKYILTLKEGIQAKNNMATDSDQTIEFTTENARSSFNVPLVTAPVTNEIIEQTQENSSDGSSSSSSSSSSTDSTTDSGSTSSSTNSSTSGNTTDSGGSSASSGTITSGDTSSSGSGSSAADGSTDSASSADSSSGTSDSSSSDTGDSSGSQNSGEDSGLDDTSSGDASIPLWVVLLVLCGAGAAGGYFSMKWMKKKPDPEYDILAAVDGKQFRKKKHRRNRKRMRIFLPLLCFFAAAAVGSLMNTDVSYAAAPSQFTIRVLVGDTVVTENVYTDDQLRAMTQTRQIYSGIDEDGYPCTVGAEGVTLEDLIVSQGANVSELQSITITAADSWSRNMIKNYLYGVDRYRFPHLSEAWKLENPDAVDDSSDSGSTSSDGSTTTVDASELKESDKEGVTPMLALRTSSAELSDKISWDDLSAIEGYRFCFGQMNPEDGSYLMYGYNLVSLDIKMSAEGTYAEEHGLQDLTGGKTMTTGGADSAGSEDVEGPYEDELTGETTDSLPGELTVQVGYYGTDYETIKVFSFDELANMPLIRQAYSSAGSDGTKGVTTALGVRLVDVITAAGIDVNSVENLGFYRNGEETSGVTALKSWLIDMERYFYPNLTGSWNYTTGGYGAGRSAVRVDTIIALKDYWDEDSTVPDFYNMDGKHRYHLVYGQTSVKSDNLAKSVMWVDTIKVQLSGSPTDEEADAGDQGKLIGTSDGTSVSSNGSSSGNVINSSTGSGSQGTGGGSGNSSGAGSDYSSSGVQDSGSGAAEEETSELDDSSAPETKIDTSGKYVYEISKGNVSYDLNSEKSDNRFMIAIVLLAAFASGGAAAYVAYRRRIR